ncbi:MAG: hypothetical protein U0174_22755 [Polyangiaceae bacterium]
MHISWKSYALKESPERVAQAYGAVATASDNGVEVPRMEKGDHVSIFPATSKAYPTCQMKPSATERTVMVVSRAITSQPVPSRPVPPP